jgi:hypothetical protein
MTVSAKVRKSLPPSRMGKPDSDEYPMPDKKHAAIAKGFAAMHHDSDKASIDAKANRILAKKRGGRIGRADGGLTDEELAPYTKEAADGPLTKEQMEQQYAAPSSMRKRGGGVIEGGARKPRLGRAGRKP